MGAKESLVMSTGRYMELLNHNIVHQKLILHSMLIKWNINKNLKKQNVTKIWILFF